VTLVYSTVNIVVNPTNLDFTTKGTKIDTMHNQRFKKKY